MSKTYPDAFRKNRTFKFDSGTEIELLWSTIRHCWRASKTSEDYMSIYGFGSTRSLAIKQLRDNLYLRVMVKLKPDLLPALLEEIKCSEDFWEIATKETPKWQEKINYKKK